MIATNFKGKIPLRNPTAFRPHLRRENLCSVLKIPLLNCNSIKTLMEFQT